jgi:hypothetical protein
MSFESLLSAIEQYASARDAREVKSPGTGSDWDCGLSGEFGEAYSSSWERGRKMDEAKERLRAALNAYIDERVRIALRGGPAA